MTTLEEQLISDVTKILGPQGILVNQVDGMTFHQDQFDFALRTAQGFCRFDEDSNKASINMLQASTGTGKTIAYLVPLFLYSARTGERVAVSTYTRQLQKQVTDKDGVFVQEWVQKITGQRLSIARRVGLLNYASLSACERLINILKNEDRTIFNEAIDFLEDLVDWLELSDGDELANSGILDDFIQENNFSSIPYGVNLKMISLDRNSPTNEMIRYENDVKKSKLADVLVVNHALLIVNAFRFAQVLDDQNVRPMSVLVCDEADRLPDAAESILSSELSLHKMRSVVLGYSNLINNRVIANNVELFYKFVMDIKPSLKNIITINDNDVFFEHAERLRKSLISVEKEVCKMLSSGEIFENEVQASNLLEFVDIVNDLNEFCIAAKSKENSAIISWSPIREFPTLRICNANSGRIIGRMWSLKSWDSEDNSVFKKDILNQRSYLKAVLFTSATMATPGRVIEKVFDDFSASVGVVRHKSLIDGAPIHHVQTQLFKIYEPLVFGKMHFVLADPNVNAPSMKEFVGDEFHFISDPSWLDYCATMIRSAHNSGKRCLVLALSFRDTLELASRLKNLPHLVVHKKGESLSNVLHQFVSDDRSILISPSAWEGINMPGMINNLVITRIPFSPMDVINKELEHAHLSRQGFSEDKIKKVIYAKSMNAARRKLAQGLGRGIRRETDEVTVWIADPRFPIPEHLRDSLDPILMSEGTNRFFSNMDTVIPKRFIENEYNNPKFCLLDGSLYTPINFGD